MLPLLCPRPHHQADRTPHSSWCSCSDLGKAGGVRCLSLGIKPNIQHPNRQRTQHPHGLGSGGGTSGLGSWRLPRHVLPMVGPLCCCNHEAQLGMSLQEKCEVKGLNKAPPSPGEQEEQSSCASNPCLQSTSQRPLDSSNPTKGWEPSSTTTALWCWGVWRQQLLMFHHQTALRRPSGAQCHRMCHCQEAEVHVRAQQAHEMVGEATGTLLADSCITGRMRKLLPQIKAFKKPPRL